MKELYAQGSINPTNDDTVLGYQERWAEYRYKPSIITGAMRTNYATTLDAWHLSQYWATQPGLNSDLIEEYAPMGRVLANGTEPHFIGDFYFDYHCVRPMPTYSVPGLIDHF